MKKLLSILCVTFLLAIFTACGNSTSAEAISTEAAGAASSQNMQSASSGKTRANTSHENDTAQSTQAEEENKMLVVYFSLAGEQYNVGVVEEGNTSIIAHMIAEQTGADLFEIEATTPYPTSHSELLDVSRQEMTSHARPEIAGTVDNMDDYDTIFIGYPIWWADMPMIVYNFLESYDLSGKTIVPFCTHGGSGLSNTESAIANITGGTMKDGLAIPGTTAQNDRETARSEVTKWLKEGGFVE